MSKTKYYVSDHDGSVCVVDKGGSDELDECEIVELLNKQMAKIKALKYDKVELLKSLDSACAAIDSFGYRQFLK